MKITTTMVSFLFPKADMVKRTDKAQLFRCKDGEHKAKIWVPLSKLEMKDDDADPTLCVVTMAKWLFMKTDFLMFVNNPSEFVVESEVTEEQLNSSNK